jgi:hypothetical protein
VRGTRSPDALPTLMWLPDRSFRLNARASRDRSTIGVTGKLDGGRGRRGRVRRLLDGPDDGWTGWWPITPAHAHGGLPAWAASRSLDKLDVFYTGIDHLVRQAAWEPSTQWKGSWELNEHWSPD